MTPASANRIQVIALLFAVAATAPSWRGGFLADDHIHLAAVEGWSPMQAGSNLYAFVSGDPAQVAGMIRDNLLPWFAAPDLKLSFWRPLTSALFQLDHHLWGRHALPYHLHTVLWYAALLLAVTALFRRVLPGPLAVLAVV